MLEKFPVKMICNENLFSSQKRIKTSLRSIGEENILKYYSATRSPVYTSSILTEPRTLF